VHGLQELVLFVSWAPQRDLTEQPRCILRRFTLQTCRPYMCATPVLQRAGTCKHRVLTTDRIAVVSARSRTAGWQIPISCPVSDRYLSSSGNRARAGEAPRRRSHLLWSWGRIAHVREFGALDFMWAPGCNFVAPLAYIESAATGLASTAVHDQSGNWPSEHSMRDNNTRLQSRVGRGERQETTINCPPSCHQASHSFC
jgi:hypothetical protein